MEDDILTTTSSSFKVMILTKNGHPVQRSDKKNFFVQKKKSKQEFNYNSKLFKVDLYWKIFGKGNFKTSSWLRPKCSLNHKIVLLLGKRGWITQFYITVYNGTHFNFSRKRKSNHSQNKFLTWSRVVLVLVTTDSTEGLKWVFTY